MVETPNVCIVYVCMYVTFFTICRIKKGRMIRSQRVRAKELRLRIKFWRKREYYFGKVEVQVSFVLQS